MLLLLMRWVRPVPVRLAALTPSCSLFLLSPCSPFYFLLIRPQQKRAKQHKAMLEALKKGDQVLTTGGLVGRVVDIDGDILSIDLGSTTVSLGRAYVVSVMDPRSKAVKEEK